VEIGERVLRLVTELSTRASIQGGGRRDEEGGEGSVPGKRTHMFN